MNINDVVVGGKRQLIYINVKKKHDHLRILTLNNVTNIVVNMMTYWPYDDNLKGILFINVII